MFCSLLILFAMPLSLSFPYIILLKKYCIIKNSAIHTPSTCLVANTRISEFQGPIMISYFLISAISVFVLPRLVEIFLTIETKYFFSYASLFLFLSLVSSELCRYERPIGHRYVFTSIVFLH